jgi:hypothetical protein
MKPILVGLCLVFGGMTAASTSAQQPQEQKSEPAHKIYVLTGCLTAGGPAPTAPYKLTGAAAVGQAPAEGKSGTGVKDEYELLPITGVVEQGVGREELQKHVGKKVEVTVRPVELTPAKSSPSAPSTSTAKPEEVPQRYTVTKIQALTAACL